MNILMVSLGCDKNLCDSEAMLGLLRDNNYNITNDEDEADAVIVNTCAFIHDAMEESINTLLEMSQLKEGRLKYLIAAGCLAERFKDDIFKEIPEIDACIGTTSFDKIVEVLNELKEKDGFVEWEERVLDVKSDISDKSTTKIARYDDIQRLAIASTDKVITSGTFYGYLKIAEGCDKFCTYCIIPHLRGRYRSVPIERLIKEAEYMAASGIKELILVAQETTCYGVDLYGKKSLPKLVHELANIEGIEWIRLLYCYPEEIDDDIVNMFVNEEKLCNYIDIPIQHSEDDVLRLMGRRTDRKSIINVINKLRSKIPDIAIRTSLISGFPGETKENHESLMEFVDEIEFDRLGVFSYSREEGTPASNFDNQVDGEVANTWRDEIMELQQEVSLDKNTELIGTRMKVIVEGYSADQDVYVGRSYRDAPSIDSLIFFECDHDLISGDFVEVEIKEVGPYDLIGGIIE